MTTSTVEVWVVRPGQFHRGDFRTGVVRLRDTHALLQVHVGQELPIRRVDLIPGEEAVVDGWTVGLRQIDPAGRGSVLLAVTPPANAETADEQPPP